MKNAVDPVLENAGRTLGSAKDVVRNARDTVAEGRRAAPKLGRSAKQVVDEGVDHVVSQSKDIADEAGERLDTARLYMVERVQERPFSATLAALGAGFVLGLLFAGNRR